MSSWTFTSESVTEGHPDKMADQISDSILDAILAQDPMARVACETMVTTGLAIVAGEITTSAYVEIPSIVRETIKGIGYDRESVGFDGNTCGVMTSIDPQSPDIAQGVDTAFETRTGSAGEDALNSQGAGDQGMMFGYACNETEDLMPLPIWLAHKMSARLAEVRKAGILPYLRPDGKTQVTFDYEDNKPVKLKTVLISTQHQPGIDAETTIKPDLVEHVIPYDLHVARAGFLDQTIAHDFLGAIELFFKIGVVGGNGQSVRCFDHKNIVPLLHLKMGQFFLRQNNAVGITDFADNGFMHLQNSLADCSIVITFIITFFRLSRKCRENYSRRWVPRRYRSS